MNKSFKAFYLCSHGDFKDLIMSLSEEMRKGWNPKNISVCIWFDDVENREAQSKMIHLRRANESSKLKSFFNSLKSPLWRLLS